MECPTQCSADQKVESEEQIEEISLEKITADVTVDVNGLKCPKLGLTPAKDLMTMKSGQIIEITTSDFSSQKIMQILAERTQNKYLGYYCKSSTYHFFIMKS